jgi:SAM-dependent methyltransferase
MHILVVIANFGSKNDAYLNRVIAEYRSMPYEIDIVITSNVQKHLDPPTEIRVGLPDKSTPFSLPFAHREVFAQRANDYELFIYSEDDMLITERHIEAFLRHSAVLPADEVPGFLRFEERPSGGIQYCDMHAGYAWDSQSVKTIGEHTFAFFSNEHAGCYMLTRSQLRHALDSGAFLVPAHDGIYGMLECGATDIFTQCGLRKMICISRISDASVHHLPNKYIDRFGLRQEDLHAQIEALRNINANGGSYRPLIQMAPGLRRGRFLRDHYSPARPEVLSLIPAQATRILSFGCGGTEVALAKRGKGVVSIAVDPVISAQAEGKGVDLITEDFEPALRRLNGEKFDCLLMIDVLHLIERPVYVLASLMEFLRPGGVVISLTPYIAGTQMLLSRFLWNEGTETYRRMGINITSPAAVRQWLRRAGATPESVAIVNGREKDTASGVLERILHKILYRQFLMLARWSGHPSKAQSCHLASDGRDSSAKVNS